MACGTGTLTIHAKERQPGATIVGLDADPSMLARARGKAVGVADVGFDLGSATHLPYGDRLFDVVLSSLLLHHLDSDAKRIAAEEVFRVLAPGGRLVLADWGPPRDAMMRAAFVTIQLVDGFGTTRDNLDGRLPEILRSAGLVEVQERGHVRTAYGSLVLLSATTPARSLTRPRR